MLPPYVEILASHTRLSMYSSVINHGTAPAAARHFFRAAGLSAALNVLRVAVQGESQLKTMPNNTAIMISFAACFALRVSAAADGGKSSLAPSVRTLIAETTDVLDRIGSTPVQRNGLSCLFARQLQGILKLAPRGSSELIRGQVGEARETHEMAPQSAYSSTSLSSGAAVAGPHAGAGLMELTAPGVGVTASDYLMFSTMSNDQLDEAINNTDVGREALTWDDFPFQNSDLDWMDWKTFA